jgi:hypothetical protein
MSKLQGVSEVFQKKKKQIPEKIKKNAFFKNNILNFGDVSKLTCQ